MVTMLNNQYQLDDNDFLSLTFSSKKKKNKLVSSVVSRIHSIYID